MPKERYYVPTKFSEKDTLTIEGNECHHIVTVMRKTVGRQLELVNGMGDLATATLAEIEKKRVHLQIEKVESEMAESRKLILAQGIPRLNRLDFIIEKGTELGMTELWLFPAERSEKKEFSANQLERLNVLSIAAMKQCGRLFLPKISILPPLSKWNDISSPLYYGSLQPNIPTLLEALKGKSSDAIFCVGPESGFSENEEVILEKMGACGVTLHHNILRTDTAAIAALVLMSQNG